MPHWGEDDLAAARARIAKGNCEPVKIVRSGPVPLYPLVRLCIAAGLPDPIPEYAFAKGIGRKWRFDYCWPLHLLALEVDGGIWSKGRHVTGTGRLANMEKQSEAAILGYRILYVTPQQMNDGTAIDRVRRALGQDKQAA